MKTLLARLSALRPGRGPASPGDRRLTRLVPLPLVTALVAGTVLVMMVWDMVGMATDHAATAMAREPKAAATPAAGMQADATPATPAPEPGGSPETAMPPEPAAPPAPSAEPKSAGLPVAGTAGPAVLPGDEAASGILADVAANLMRRRQLIEARELELDLREASLGAAKDDVMAQLEQLARLKDEIAAMVDEVEADEQKRRDQLVKVYESMKSKSAAAIFDRLGMDVLLPVAREMRESKLAAVLQAMDPSRARQLTTELAREREFPGLGEP